MRKLAVLMVLVLVASSCRGGNDSGPQTRTVRVDYASDEFASFLMSYFPVKVTLRPGDSVVFKQTWTGEAHTVTMGTLVDRLFKVADPLVERFRKGDEPTDEEIGAPEIRAAEKDLPVFFGEEGVAQNGAQPCYLETGTPPSDPNQACPKRPQPEFNGRQSYFNSGFIPYGGERGNEFTVKLADDIKPGTYSYYCNLHGPPMSGKIVVKAPGSAIPSDEEVNEQAFEEIEKQAAPLRRALKTATEKRRFTSEGITRTGNLAGIYVPEVFGGLNEFTPDEIKARVGQKVTWSIMGPHTISFKVPPYFPIFTVRKDGTVVYNPALEKEAGGAPPPPPDPFEDGPPSAEERAAPKPEVKEVDGGAWNGKGFWSSGLVTGEPYLKYSLRFSRPGTYEYACLIHPKMVGTITVR